MKSRHCGGAVGLSNREPAVAMYGGVIKPSREYSLNMPNQEGRVARRDDRDLGVTSRAGFYRDGPQPAKHVAGKCSKLEGRPALKPQGCKGADDPT